MYGYWQLKIKDKNIVLEPTSVTGWVISSWMKCKKYWQKAHTSLLYKTWLFGGIRLSMGSCWGCSVIGNRPTGSKTGGIKVDFSELILICTNGFSSGWDKVSASFADFGGKSGAITLL